MKKYVCNSPNEGGKSVLYNTFHSLCICLFIISPTSNMKSTDKKLTWQH